MSKQILIVEDERSLREALKKRLITAGFEVSTATNGEDGLNVALDIKPDLIILDLYMPKMTGIELLEKLRDDKWGLNANVIVLSNESETKDVLQTLQYRVSRYLVKADWSLEKIVDEVHSVLN
jgi:two-component system, OmpR family, alkaline phosphatase synthesis response regulator PhoP